MSGDIHALSGAYAVDALDEFERAQFERHLAGCDTCREEVASLREGAAQLADLEPVAPPAALRDRVLADIASTRPVPPLVAATTERVPSVVRRRWPALLAAAAAFVVIGGAGASVWHPWESDRGPTIAGPSTLDPVAQVLDAPDAKSVSRPLGSGASVTVTMSPSLGKAVVTANGLPTPPSGHVYELWLQHDTMIPAGFLTDPSQPVELQGNVLTARGLGITVEKSDGAATPSKNLVGTVSLQSA